MGMFILGWIIGVFSMLALMIWTVYKNKGMIGVANSPKEAADIMMTMLNVNQEVREDVKNRLNV
jgi:hypothetical protein